MVRLLYEQHVGYRVGVVERERERQRERERVREKVMYTDRSDVATGAKLCCCNVELCATSVENKSGPNQFTINLLINRRRKGKGVNSGV